MNGFEVDTPATGNLVSFPSPSHTDEHIDLEGATSLTASWVAPPLPKSPKYNVYFGTSPDNLTRVSVRQEDTSIVFSGKCSDNSYINGTCIEANGSKTGLNTLDKYYWRVDVVDGCHLYIGNAFMFRLAHLAFEGAEGWGLV